MILKSATILLEFVKYNVQLMSSADKILIRIPYLTKLVLQKLLVVSFHQNKQFDVTNFVQQGIPMMFFCLPMTKAENLMVDGDDFLETESKWIWIVHIMTSIVCWWVVSGDEFLVTQSTDIWIVPSITLYVSRFIVLGDESFSTQSTLI